MFIKKTILLILGLFLAVHLISCKKSDSKTSSFQDNAISESSKKMENSKSSKNESGQKQIDFDWSKMNYNMLSSLIFDIQVNPEKYNNKRFKMSGNFYTSVYEGNRYYSVLVWDPTGCCPTGLDFIPPADMKYPENFPETDEKITVIGIFKYFNENELDYFIFQAEEIIRENK